MKDKPIVIIITLTAGLIACVCCILNHVGLLATLLPVLISLIVFLFIGQIVNSIFAKQNKEAEKRLKDEKQKLEEEALKERTKEEEENESNSKEESDSK